MDPCPFVRLIVESLSLKLPTTTKPITSTTGIHSTTTPCYCKLRLKNFPPQTALIPLSSSSPPDSTSSSVYFHLDPTALRRAQPKPLLLTVSVYTGRMGQSCVSNGGKTVGRVSVVINLNGSVTKPIVFQDGWMKLGNDVDKPAAVLHMTVRSEPDPRFLFQFGGEAECSPVVFQIQGNIRQPVFSCKFSADRNSRSRLGAQALLSKAPLTVGPKRSLFLILLQNGYLTRKLFSTTAIGNSQENQKISVTFFDNVGEQEIKVPLGMSMLEAAHENDIELEGACEGSLACSTCHVIVMDVEQYNKLEDPTDEENDMLDLAFGLTETSRLGCQVIAKPELDGLRLALPAATRNFAFDGYKPKPH